MQYILGIRFYGIKFKGRCRVLIPPGETENCTLDAGNAGKESTHGVGHRDRQRLYSRNLNNNRLEWDVWAVDISQDALELVKWPDNEGVELHLRQTDILDREPSGLH